MLDLEKIGVSELSIKEQKEVEGGWLFILASFLVGVLIGLIEGQD